MFEEIEARAYKNLRGNIKSLINDMIEKMHIENAHSYEYSEMKRYTESEYHAGYSDGIGDTLHRINNIVNTIDAEVAEQIDEEDRRFSEEIFADEIATDSSRSKQS